MIEGIFPYTISVLKKTLDDVKKLIFVTSVIAQIIYIIYHIFAIVTDAGILVIHAIILPISVAYFVFYLVINHYVKRGEGKEVKKIVGKIYKYLKMVLQLVTITVAIINLIIAGNEATSMNILLTAVMIFAFILTLLIEIIGTVLSARISLLIEAFDADKERLNPVKKFGGFVNKITHKEVFKQEEPTKKRLLVEQILVDQKEKKKADDEIAATVEEKRKERQIKKDEKRLEKQKRIAQKDYNRAEKLAKKLGVETSVVLSSEKFLETVKGDLSLLED